MRAVSLCLLLFTSIACPANLLDSLLTVLPSITSDSHRVMVLRDISWELQINQPDSSISYARASLTLAEQIDNQYCLAKAKGQLANSLYYAGDVEGAINAYAECAQLHGMINDTAAMAAINSNIGALLFKAQQYDDALGYFRLAYKAMKNKGNSPAIGNYLSNIGSAFVYFEAYDSAIVYLRQSLEMLDNRQTRSLAQLNLAYALCKDTASPEVDSALILLNESRRYFVETDDYNSLLVSYTTSARAYQAKSNFSIAATFIDSALQLDDKVNDWRSKEGLYTTGYSIHYKLGNWTTAIQFQDLAMIAKDSLFVQQANLALRDAERKYHTDQVRQQNKIQELTIANEKAENRKKQNYIYFALGGVLLLGALAFLLFRGNRIKQKANEELSEANTQIQHQKNIIEEKNRDITDSINYARFIQSSILPDTSGLGKHFADHFVYYQPRDIVSGDFYWVSEQDDSIYVSASDCTGHGVPGGFVSMLCSSALTQSITENSTLAPNELLTRVNQNVLRVLAKEGQSESVKDGMDSALIRYNKKTGKVEFSGAQRPIIRVRKGEDPVRVRGDKNPIGGWTPPNQAFTLHEIDVQPGDHLYMFSDGYADQFGGPKLKKFMIGRLRALFEEMVNIDLDMSEQHQLLSTRLNEWKGDQEQIDDVLVVGLKI